MPDSSVFPIVSNTVPPLPPYKKKKVYLLTEQLTGWLEVRGVQSRGLETLLPGLEEGLTGAGKLQAKREAVQV